MSSQIFGLLLGMYPYHHSCGIASVSMADSDVGYEFCGLRWSGWSHHLGTDLAVVKIF